MLKCELKHACHVVLVIILEGSVTLCVVRDVVASPFGLFSLGFLLNRILGILYCLFWPIIFWAWLSGSSPHVASMDTAKQCIHTLKLEHHSYRLFFLGCMEFSVGTLVILPDFCVILPVSFMSWLLYPLGKNLGHRISLDTVEKSNTLAP
jgi:hypothetical protein